MQDLHFRRDQKKSEQHFVQVVLGKNCTSSRTRLKKKIPLNRIDFPLRNSVSNFSTGPRVHRIKYADSRKSDFDLDLIFMY